MAQTQQQQLEALFQRAVKQIQSLPAEGPYQPSIDEKLAFYSLFKQATKGPNKTKKPAFYDVVAKTKWSDSPFLSPVCPCFEMLKRPPRDRGDRDAWKKHGSMTKEQAIRKYLELYVRAARKINNEQSLSEAKEIEAILKPVARL